MLLKSKLFGCVVLLVIVSCSQEANLPVSAGFGPDPVLPPPPKVFLPTVNIAPAKGWPNGEHPSAAEGLTVTAFADNLDHPRWVFVLPNGDVLVAESNAPPKPEDFKGVKGWLMKKAMKVAGSGGPSANRISLLRDGDGDGKAEFRSLFLTGLNSPFGMELIGNAFYVANTDSIVRFPYREGQTKITEPGVKIMDLPAGPINRHWTRNIIAGQDGKVLYATVGSNSNVGEKGLDKELGRAAIWQLDLESGHQRIFASGLRNPNGLAWEPESGVLWTTVNERDELGSDLVPDFLTSVQEDGFYGWPYSYFGGHLDLRVKPQRPDLVGKAIVPDYALGTHTACLGLASSRDAALAGQFNNGMFIGQHGSWNREPPSGYKVIFVPFHQGRPHGAPVDVLTGFLSKEGNALGRPVGVAVDKRGALLVADDVGNIIWRVAGQE
ncbi:MAG: sorbosone dehydrogenase [Desulfobulbaceae bacterium BRH_c16a]|nr:MAG: sorbosone dehydrogenase [Desulfobulbaceae bacterium BRH_c16a]